MTRIYHGHASPSDLQTCRESAPSLAHGVEWSDSRRMPIRDEPYILDNGAYAAAKNGDPWDRREWYDLLTKSHKQPREPDFVVLPDVYGDIDATHRRHERFVEVVRSHGYAFYAVGQPGATPDRQVRFAEAIDADGLFLGGPEEWKRSVGSTFRELTERHGLQLHIGQPGNLGWAVNLGVDSMDTTSVVVNDSWERLTQLESQATLEVSTRAD